MRAIATDVPIPWCICQSVTCLCHAMPAELIDVLFGVKTLIGPKEHYIR